MREVDKVTDFVNSWNQGSLSIPQGPLGLIAMRGCEELGIKINNWLIRWHDNLETVDETPLYSALGAGRENFLIKSYCPRFSTGEAKGMIKETVRGYDIYILCDVGAYNCEFEMYGRMAPMSPDDHFQDLKRIIAAIGGKAKRVNVIMPMLYESRQHRRSSRESLDCAMALQELERLGVANIITFDAHDNRVQNAIPISGFESVLPSYQIFKALLRADKTLRIDKQHMMIVSPDEGALDRNIFYSAVLEVHLGLFYKRRDYTRVVNGRNPIIAHEYMGDDVDGKDIFVADDVIASGESILEVARELKNRRANRIFAAATFALFTKGIEEFDKAYEEGLIDKVISTNLTYRREEIRKAPWYAEADLSKYIAYIVATLNHDRSLSGLLDPYGRLKKLMAAYVKEQTATGIRLA
jgi:ribose-phosphate pyrophosphokinase